MTALIVPPVTPNGMSLSHVWPGRLEYTSPTGGCRVVMDTEAFDFHVDLSPDVETEFVRMVLAKMNAMGLEPLDEDEAPGELLEDGYTRIYFLPIDPVSSMDIGFISIPHDARSIASLEEVAPPAPSDDDDEGNKGGGSGLGPVQRLAVLAFLASALVPKQQLAVLAGAA